MEFLEALSDVKQLTATDALYLYAESSRTPMHVGAILIYDPSTAPGGKVRHKDIIKFVEDRLHVARTFRQKVENVPLGLDYPYWVDDDDFDIEYHIRHFALPHPGDWRQLCILAARLHSRSLDLSRPLWEFNIIEGLDNVKGVPKGAYAIVVKIHHSAVDGVSGAEILSAINSIDPNDKVDPPEKEWTPGRKPSSIELLARAQINNATQPVRTLQLLSSFAPGATKLLEGLRTGDFKSDQIAPEIPQTRFNKPVSAHRVVGGVIFDLAKFKAIRKVVQGPTLNDVVMSICGGSLRRYLGAYDELPEDSLISMAPISVRGEGEKGDMGNQVSAMMVQLGTHIADPIERLKFVHQSAEDSKALTNAIGARQLAEVSSMSPALLSGLGARLYSQFGLANHMKPICNTVVTNVPGPPVPLYSHGAKLVAYHGLGPLIDGMGIIHPVFSYNGQMGIAFNACRKMLPDPEYYESCIEDAFAELCAAAGVSDTEEASDTAQAPKPKRSRKKETSEDKI